MSRQPKLERFNNQVKSKYQVYNSLFMTLPFHGITDTGVLLPLFDRICTRGYDNKYNPEKIVNYFFEKYQRDVSEEDRYDLLFRFIQYIERQVVLFDAIEDSAYRTVNNMDGRGTLRNIKEEAEAQSKTEDLKAYLQDFKIRPVLTAHPTQFYPGAVLGIINDLSAAINDNNLEMIKKLLSQLGKTPFFKKEKPTPYDEAVSLIWYLENVFYKASSHIYNYLHQNVFKGEFFDNEVIDLGFWPGGDRDGNPFVTTEITLKVASRLRSTIIKNYYRDVRKLRRRITFNGTEEPLADLERRLFDSIAVKDAEVKVSLEELQSTLKRIRKLVIERHESLFLEEIDDLLNKITMFGYHFAVLDIRQDSRVHMHVMEEIVKQCAKDNLGIFPDNYLELDEAKQIEILQDVKGKVDPATLEDDIARKTLESVYAIREIQAQNGERSCNRYIISNNQTGLNVMQAFSMFHLTGWENPTVDIVPLFETVPDLKIAHEVMRKLYTNPAYAAHLKARGMKQTIMLGFSDGTKDGGYLMANWSIFKAKEELTKISREFGIKVIFFDGRGGPPARGGGKTHQFYASLGETIEDEEIQLTVQGQTISSNFGTPDSCQYNLEQLLSSGIFNGVFFQKTKAFPDADRSTMEELAEISYKTYSDFKAHPKFLGYLERMSTLKYYAKTNIGSRPSKRGKSDKLDFSDLRAIPFVGSWSQLKQNVPGFFGVGTAIEAFEERGEFDKVKSLYENSLFFKTLLENSMMSLTKSFFGLTAYMQDDPEFGAFWDLIHDEFERTKRMLLKLTGYSELMEEEQAGKASIQERERIVLPLLTIQQFALKKIQEMSREENPDQKKLDMFEKMVTRSLFGNINASRNSA
ncbi:phosphoenolpyruvate carboxylase [Leeuwenhoekiella marinoflava]|uniref:Phosphoenolpyruvate carboxylase n=2 Tax=Leeuwenhoekiella marinoflava TaxID=988 RepID=A0A4Q0PCL9_9FLAO|nr:phosphoenolpyruvate carboxylase [Leeuwenhoekiella marinoflava]RXG24116.1 phosphoenolpyruvate carboxylase type 1 [Leeuwenhoekiella marinoflava]SHF98150.1 Phosphoenolpyruvate carboxylase, type 1 [Leeuwenhoekiella marinoflava DSM 3653]